MGELVFVPESLCDFLPRLLHHVVAKAAEQVHLLVRVGLELWCAAGDGRRVSEQVLDGKEEVREGVHGDLGAAQLRARVGASIGADARDVDADATGNLLLPVLTQALLHLKGPRALHVMLGLPIGVVEHRRPVGVVFLPAAHLAGQRVVEEGHGNLCSLLDAEEGVLARDKVDRGHEGQALLVERLELLEEEDEVGRLKDLVGQPELDPNLPLHGLGLRHTKQRT
mmetsp:Transcript_19410/g.64105  ORF Transcript_19410/g.64105 Transcript_19410/m.64105 type:complete len:225 (-) Transcript_19410:1755-2429(-)